MHLFMFSLNIALHPSKSYIVTAVVAVFIERNVSALQEWKKLWNGGVFWNCEEVHLVLARQKNKFVKHFVLLLWWKSKFYQDGFSQYINFLWQQSQTMRAEIMLKTGRVCGLQLGKTKIVQGGSAKPSGLNAYPTSWTKTGGTVWHLGQIFFFFYVALSRPTVKCEKTGSGFFFFFFMSDLGRRIC